MSDIDLQRLAELRVKAENGELTEEEQQEVQAMFSDFREAMQPAMEGMANAMSEATTSMAEGLRPLMEDYNND